jgi:hypothetical protein
MGYKFFACESWEIMRKNGAELYKSWLQIFFTVSLTNNTEDLSGVL